MNSTRGKKYSPSKFDTIQSPKLKYQATPTKPNGRYSPLKNYQTKAQNVINKYNNKKPPKIGNVHHSYNFDLSTLPSTNNRRDNSGSKNEMVM